METRFVQDSSNAGKLFSPLSAIVPQPGASPNVGDCDVSLNSTVGAAKQVGGSPAASVIGLSSSEESGASTPANLRGISPLPPSDASGDGSVPIIESSGVKNTRSGAGAAPEFSAHSNSSGYGAAPSLSTGSDCTGKNPLPSLDSTSKSSLSKSFPADLEKMLESDWRKKFLNDIGTLNLLFELYNKLSKEKKSFTFKEINLFIIYLESLQYLLDYFKKKHEVSSDYERDANAIFIDAWKLLLENESNWLSELNKQIGSSDEKSSALATTSTHTQKNENDVPVPTILEKFKSEIYKAKKAREKAEAEAEKEAAAAATAREVAAAAIAAAATAKATTREVAAAATAEAKEPNKEVEKAEEMTSAKLCEKYVGTRTDLRGKALIYLSDRTRNWKYSLLDSFSNCFPFFTTSEGSKRESFLKSRLMPALQAFASDPNKRQELEEVIKSGINLFPPRTYDQKSDEYKKSLWYLLKQLGGDLAKIKVADKKLEPIPAPKIEYQSRWRHGIR